MKFKSVSSQLPALEPGQSYFCVRYTGAFAKTVGFRIIVAAEDEKSAVSGLKSITTMQKYTVLNKVNIDLKSSALAAIAAWRKNGWGLLSVRELEALHCPKPQM